MHQPPPRSKQVIRRVPSTRLADFDEQLWPVNVLLLILAGFVGGIIAAQSDFDTPLLLYNGWCRLGILGLIVAVLAWSILRLDGWMQRRLQFGVFLSLLVHLWLSLITYHVYLGLFEPPETDAAEQFEEPRLVKLPDYHWQEDSQEIAVDQTLEKPVETVTPDQETEEIVRTEVERVPAERPSEEEPQAEQQQPSPAEMERAELSAPHRSVEPAGEQISRREVEMPSPAEQVDAPQINGRPQQSPALDAQVRPHERQAASAEIERRDAAQPQNTAQPQNEAATQAAPARRQSSESTSLDSPREVPAPVRRETPTAEVRPATVDSVPTSQLAETAKPTRLAPSMTDIARRETTPTAARPDASSVPDSPTIVPVDVAESPRRTDRTEQARTEQTRTGPQVAAARSRVAAESVSPNEVPNLPATENPAAPTTVDLEAATGEVARSIDGRPTPERRTVEGAETATTSEVAPATPLQPQRTQTASTSGAPSEIAAPNMVRSQNSSPAEVGEASADGAMVVDARPSDEPSSEPSAAPAETSLTKAAGGAPGVSRQRNFDSELPGTNDSAEVATAAARRAQATQQAEWGSDSSPSEPARIAKARAGADAPSATLPAEQVTVADAAGARRASEVEASASAAATRAAAKAPRGRVTAAAGHAPVDLGPPRVVSRQGRGATSGGGEPTRSESAKPGRIGKAAASGDTGSSRVADAESVPTAGSSGQAGATPAPAIEGPARGAPAVTAIARTPRPTQAASPTGGASKLTAASPGVTRRANQASESQGGAEAPGQVATAAPVGRQARGEPAVGDEKAESVELGSVELGSSATASSNAGTPARGDLGEPAIGSESRRVADLPARAGAPSTLDHADTTTGGGAGPTLPSGSKATQRRTDATAEVGSAMDSTPARASPGKTRGLEAVGGDDVVSELEIDVSPSDAPAGGEDQLAARIDRETARKSSQGLPVRIAAPEGSGGLSATPALDVGLPSRRARAESEVVHSGVGRMILERSGGKLADVRVQDTSVPGFRQRDREMRRELANQRGGSEASERAVEAGLDFLARHQNPDGSWSLHDFWQGRPGYENAGAGQMHSDTAATGLSLLAFLGAGYTHTDGKYRPVIARGLAYLVGNQVSDGDLFVPQDEKSNINVWLYSHGIASIALCEAYGMTRDATLREPAQRALSFIVSAQNPTEGGWRYAPRQGSDTSVSGWQLMALKSGELAGLQVPPECYQRVTAWLDGAQAQANPAVYVYRPKAKQPHQRTPSRVMTAEALLMRQYLGWRRDNPYMQAGADYLRTNLPVWDSAEGPQRDSYYWYYATQVMFQVGGSHWEEWNGRLRALLVDSQVHEGQLGGSWEPLGTTPDRWGREGGRIYVTAMHLLMLEVYYRHLPLYQNLEE